MALGHRGWRPVVTLTSAIGAPFAWMGVWVSACTSAHEDPIGATRAPILRGESAPMDEAVGLVGVESGLGSGTLIREDVVLTAGHAAVLKLSGFYTGLGASTPLASFATPPPGMTAHAIEETAIYPDYDPSSPINVGAEAKNLDVALLRLTKPVSGIKPVALATTEPAIGTKCRAIGYGGYDDVIVDGGRPGSEADLEVGLRRQGGYALTKIYAGYFLGKGDGVAVWGGDSGGAFLCGDKVVGVIKARVVSGTAADLSATRVVNKPVADWIAKTLELWAKEEDPVDAGDDAADTDASTIAETDAGPTTEPGKLGPTATPETSEGCNACGQTNDASWLAGFASLGFAMAARSGKRRRGSSP